jgi:Carboxypeptidase regulatory-like domain
MRISIGRFVLGTLLVFACSGLSWAQATATLNGRVVDQAGAVLPGVAVTAINAATGAVRDTVTNAEGLYALPALTPGIYTIKVDLAGFSAPERANIELITGSSLTVDVQMAIANIQETLTVTGQSPLVEATQATLSSSIRQTEVVQLPMLNRTMGALMTLLPGAREVTGAISAHGTSSNFVSLGGGGGQNYNMLVDGIDNKEDHCGGTEIVYSLEGIQEFKVLTTGYQAEYGKGTATVLMATKSGTNKLHGTGFLYGRNEKLITTDYFSKPANGGLGKPPFKRLQFGGSAGGPVLKDRAWFFGSVERVQQDFSVARSATQFAESEYVARLIPDVVNTHSILQPSRDLLSQAKVNFNLSHDHSIYARYSGEVGYVDNDAMGPTSMLLKWAQPMDRNKQNLWNVASGWTWIISTSPSPTTTSTRRAHFRRRTSE